MAERRHVRVCHPDDVASLLPEALAGEFVLAPVADDAALGAVRPDEPVTEPDAALIVTTSGSTGRPKGVVLSASAIRAAAASFRTRYGAFTWTLALPAQHVAGVMVVARGLLDLQWGGQGVHQIGRHLTGLEQVGAEPGSGRNAISIVPTQLVRALADTTLTAALARFDAVLVGGAAMSPEVLDRARDAGIVVLTSYGMSETCGGCVFDGVPLPGVDVTLGERGRIALGGPMVFSGYRGDLETTSSTLVGGSVVTNDRGEWREDGHGPRRLAVLGRFDDVVISGGVNVDLAAVQRAVDTVGRDAAVVDAEDAEWGARIVLATTDAAVDLDWWRQTLRTTLQPAALPRQVVVLDELPRTASGKLDRRALRTLVARWGGGRAVRASGQEVVGG